jgi:O-Antigen ligase
LIGRGNRPQIAGLSSDAVKTFRQPKRIVPADEPARVIQSKIGFEASRSQQSSTDFQISTSMKFVLMAFLAAMLLPVIFRIGPLAFTGSRFFLTVTVIPAIAVVVMRQRLQLADYLLLGYVLWATVCFIANHELGTAIQSAGSNFVEVAGAYFLGRMTVQYPSSYIFLSKCLLALVFFLLPFALYESLTGNAVIIDVLSKFLPTHPDVSMERRLGLERAQTVFEHPILFGVFCAGAYSPAVLVITRNSGRFKQVVFGALVALATFLSLATGAFLNVIWQILIVTWNRVFKNVKNRWLLLFALGVLAYIFVDAASNRTPFEVFISYFTFELNSSYNRVLIWKYGTEELYRHPVFGIGLNDWARASWMGSTFDNFWLLRAMRYGFPGLIFLASTVLVTANGIARRVDSIDTDWKAVSLSQLCVLIGTSVSLVTVDLWSGSQTLFFLFLGAAVSLNQTYLNTTDSLILK